MKKLEVNLLEDRVLKAILLFAIPILLSNIFQQLYNTADTMIVGNFLGDKSLAAIGASMAVFQLLIGFTLGMGNGMTIVVARNYGTKDEKLLKESVASTLVMGVIIVGVMMLIAHFFLKDLLVLLRTPEEILEETYTYISIITMFMGITFTYNLVSGLYRAVGNSFMPLVFLIISSVLNIILDIVFIVFIGMGIEGAAIATVIAQSVSVVLSLIYMKVKLPILIPSTKHFKVDWKVYGEIVGQGLSMAMMYSLIFIGTIILQYAINDMGYLIIAGHTTARRVSSLFMMPLGTIATAVSTFVSQNKGADNRDRIIEGVRKGFEIVTIWSFIAIVAVFLVSGLVMRVISGSDESLVIETGTRYLMWNVPFYIVLGPLFVIRFTLQGLGEKLIPLVSSFIELVLKFVFVIWVIPKLGYFGVILCEPIIWIFMVIQLIDAYRKNTYLFPNRI